MMRYCHKKETWMLLTFRFTHGFPVIERSNANECLYKCSIAAMLLLKISYYDGCTQMAKSNAKIIDNEKSIHTDTHKFIECLKLKFSWFFSKNFEALCLDLSLMYVKKFVSTKKELIDCAFKFVEFFFYSFIIFKPIQFVSQVPKLMKRMPLLR